jgi:23S rRNA (uracil1939-C5)-methyltransferase
MRVTIEKMVYGGAGLARTEHGVVFVPRTAPGDVVEVALVERKKDYATARVVELLEPSPDRQNPVCPNYEAAGCCHWQHIRYGRQLQIKESIVRETLQRTGRLEWNAPIPVVHGPENNYRLRASFHVWNGRLGFVEERSHRVVPIPSCSSLCFELNNFIPRANEALTMPRLAGTREVHAVCGPPVIAAFDRERFGEGPARIRVKDFEFDLHPEAFFQSNRFLLSLFLDEVLRAAMGARRILDLFCGSGFFTIPLGRQSDEVLGVEYSRTAVRQAKLNASLNGVKNARFFEGAVDEVLKQSQDLRPDLIVMNPPRTGAGKDAVDLVARLAAGRIIYASCNPATFAREAATLSARGYRLEGLTLVDQFPNTHHIELLANFLKN